MSANAERRPARRSRRLAVIVLGLLGGGLSPQSHAQDGQAAIRAADDAPASELEATLNAEPGNPLAAI